MKSFLCTIILGFCGLSFVLAQQPITPPPVPEVDYEFSEETVLLLPSRVARAGGEAQIFLELDSALWSIVELPIRIDDSLYVAQLSKGRGAVTFPAGQSSRTLHVQIQEFETELDLPVVDYPMWLSLLPPLIAIFLALILKEVYLSLFIGVITGAAIMGVAASDSWLGGIGGGFLTALDTYVIDALADSDHMAILVFSLLIGGMVAVISKNGGMQGIVKRLSGLAKSPRSAQLTTYLMGILIFFDDYANTLVVGNTMRPVTDRLKISREKLSYLVDSTAAPVAALAFVTTWIGAELGYISDGITGLHGFPADQSPYLIFLNSLAYSFYPILTLIFILMLILTGKDFGPMLKAERRARQTGIVDKSVAKAGGIEEEFSPIEGLKPKARYAVIPVLVLVLGVLAGLLYTGSSADTWADDSTGFLRKLSITIGNADSYKALLWASLSALLTAILMSGLSGRMSLRLSVESMLSGFKAMMSALMILALAWALSGVTADMHTAGFLTDMLGRNVWPVWIPAIAFLLSGLVAFSTGSSWSTMAILYPIMVPLAWEASRNGGLEVSEALAILYNTVASVLAGSVLGDHISPISDTTILSSLASRCDHISHVRTQIPYAMVVGTIAIFFGIIPSSIGLSPWISLVLCVGLLAFVVWRLGRRV